MTLFAVGSTCRPAWSQQTSESQDEVARAAEAFGKALAEWLGMALRDAMSVALRAAVSVIFAYDVSPSGEIVYVKKQGDCMELVIQRTPSEAVCIERACAPQRSILLPRFSPDGRRVAYLLARDDSDSQAPSSDETGIYIYDLKTGAKQRVYHGVVSNFMFTPDGQNLILEREDGVYILSREGNLLPTWANRILSYNLSPAGELVIGDISRIYFRNAAGELVSEESGERVVASWRELLNPSAKELAVRRLNNNGQLKALIDRSSGRVAWSRDGKRLAYIVPRANSCEVWLYDTRGKHQLLIRQVDDLVGLLRWSYRGDKLYFITLSSCDAVLWCIEVATGEVTKLHEW
jgi:dipeptidyl aminopeptidase/acylaminoacyl peptidase